MLLRARWREIRAAHTRHAYTCNADDCGAHSLVLIGRPDGAWDLLCRNGHAWVGIPGNQLEITP
jgi:hypothetical protein